MLVIAILSGNFKDFDGDYFQVITPEAVVNSFQGNTEAGPLPDFEKPELRDVDVKSLADVHADFLSQYHPMDRIGLHHYQWQMCAGEGKLAASSSKTRLVAAAYCKSLDVEKGKPSPKLAPYVADSKWDFMKGGDPMRPSPTAAGQCYREAVKAYEEFSRAKALRTSGGADMDLMKAWQRLLDEIGPSKCKELKKLANKVRGEFLGKIKEECKRAEHAAGSKNPYASCIDDELRGEWLMKLREEVAREVDLQDASLAQLALASWHMKYVDQGVSSREEDPDPTYPWVLFRPELLEYKECLQLCRKRELGQCHASFRKLQRNIGQAAIDPGKEVKSKEAIECLKSDMKCRQCRDAKDKLLADLHLDGSWSEAAEAMRAISGRGELEEVDCEDLRFSKAYISDTLEHGMQSGITLEELVDQLVKGQESVSKLMLTAVRFHGELYVVEGNRRLWCIKEAQKRLQRKLQVRVRVPNLYLGFIQRQEHKEPALPYFLKRFDPRFEGRSVEVERVETLTAEAAKALSPQSCEQPQAIASPGSHSVPKCPKCNADMVQRNNKSDGSKFWGCKEYFSSGCRGRRDIRS